MIKKSRLSHKILVFAMAVIMVLTSIMPSTISYATESNSGDIQDYNEAYYDSYEEAVSGSQESTGQVSDYSLSDSGDSVDSYTSFVRLDSVASAGKYLRQAMVSRTQYVNFTFVNKEGYNYKTAYFTIRDEAFKETGVYDEGAYIMWNWGGTNVNYKENSDGSISYKLDISYLSTAYQEQRITNEVNRLLSNEFAGWQDMHDYEKVKMVYEWMTSTYTYVEGKSNHSTYSGIINHRTVCQGFATSMYRILGEMGLNVRVIANDSHGWNIVQLGRYWYSLDATWDVGRKEANWDYFLPSETSFILSNHIRGTEYNTTEFHLAHPMGWGAYDYSAERDKVGVDYRTHVQSYGWQNYVYDGAVSGTTGEAKRLEAIEIRLGNTGAYDLGVQYRTHIQSYGWENNWKTNGAMSGTSGEAKRLEAIQIKLTGADADKFDIYYRVHAQSYGWLGWAKNGQMAGTAGQAKRLESIQILVLDKGEVPSGLIGYSYVDYGKSSKSENPSEGLVNYRTHVQSYGWQGYVYDGSISGTSKEAKRLEGINISLGDTGYDGGIRYTTHVQSYGWQQDKDNQEEWAKDGAMSGTSKEAKRLEGIRICLYGEVADYYDVYYRVHAQSFGWLDWACNGQDAGTAGLAKRLEAIQIVVLPKGSAKPGSTARPFVSN